MKPDIHPEWHPQSQVICGCGNTWTTGATVPVIRTDVCSNCHPFFTGEQRIVDTAGQVERFMRRLEKREEKAAPVGTKRSGNGAKKKARRTRPQARRTRKSGESGGSASSSRPSRAAQTGNADGEGGQAPAESDEG